MSDPRPIGVFDSGVGGLTVLRAIREILPQESFVYLGDTARLPYGTKSPATVARYARQSARVLVERDVKLLVIACNTASAVAIDDLRDHFAPLPVVGVIEPGARAACASSQTGRIAVIGTEGTVRGGAYERAIAALRPDAVVSAQACPLFVPLAEEGWIDGEVPRAVATSYLEPLLAGGELGPDCLVLGCTHFPVLRSVLQGVVGPSVRLVDSAATTALAVLSVLERERMRTSGRDPTLHLLATDGPDRFARVGAIFLADSIGPGSVELVDL